MKLLRYGEPGMEKPGILDNEGNVRDLSLHCADISSASLANGLLDEISGLDIDSLPMVDATVRIGPCVGGVGKMICIGLNYADHAAEAGAEVPSEPILFSKAISAIVGPYDNLEIPRNSTHCDWEVELGVVIGKNVKYVDEVNALDYVAGYCTVNDVSEREFQIKRKGQWVKGKSHDTFGPLG
ncbi:MAG: fumarylacetoacetate hydrolase family protein, partial [Pseudomonadota bacterium]